MSKNMGTTAFRQKMRLFSISCSFFYRLNTVFFLVYYSGKEHNVNGSIWNRKLRALVPCDSVISTVAITLLQEYNIESEKKNPLMNPSIERGDL